MKANKIYKTYCVHHISMKSHDVSKRTIVERLSLLTTARDFNQPFLASGFEVMIYFLRSLPGKRL